MDEETEGNEQPSVSKQAASNSARKQKERLAAFKFPLGERITLRFDGSKEEEKTIEYMCRHIRIDMAETGASATEIARDFGMGKQRLMNYAEKEPRIMEALKEGKESAKAWYFTLIRLHLVEYFKGPRLNSSLIQLIMRNRFKASLDEEQKDNKFVLVLQNSGNGESSEGGVVSAEDFNGLDKSENGEQQESAPN
jgi:hypothetical protein